MKAPEQVKQSPKHSVEMASPQLEHSGVNQTD
jgi:hypothetical protein